MTVALLLVFFHSWGGLRPSPHAQDNYEQAFQELRKMAPRPDRVASVKDLVLRRDAIELRLWEGTLYLLTPVAGQTAGAAFVGSGSVSFSPPLEVERAHLRRVLKDSLVNQQISAAVFLFADSTLAEFERLLTFSTGGVAAEAAGRVGDALEFLTDGGKRWAEPTLMAGLLNQDRNGFFAAYVKRQRGEDVMFLVDPHQVEEILLLRRGKLRNQRVQVVSQFQRAEDLRANVAPADERPEPLHLDAYTIDATIEGDFDFFAAATLQLAARRDGIRWVPLGLFDELEVDSVLEETGAPATFFRAKRSSGLWVRLDPPLQNGQKRSVRVVYHGDLIARGSVMEQFLPPRTDPRRQRMGTLDRWAFIKSTSLWYPRYSFWQASAMELTFRTPIRYRFASIGRLVETREERGVRITRWVTEVPTQQASFNIGDFEEFRITDPRIPPVTVHMNAEAHARLSDIFMAQRDPESQVGGDVANSLAFFTRVFGTPLFRQYYATEIPYFHGQAFPGLIHLSWWTFQTVRDTGWEEIFRAHEMAHQWWGIGVEPVTDRDAWLSEGFAMFAGLWYMQLILGDNEKYFKQLREWRDGIRGKGDDAPPVGLGYRVLETYPEQYDLVVYRKGAWVLHMLRNMMLDFRTMKEDSFSVMMKDFYQTYRGRRASTKDFQRVVERHAGRPMDWFFDQWVDGTGVPTYILSWRAEKALDGQFLLRMRIRQQEVPESFVMRVPVSILSADGSRTVVKVDVRGPVLEAELRLPSEPKELELNPLESVLAEVKREGWR